MSQFRFNEKSNEKPNEMANEMANKRSNEKSKWKVQMKITNNIDPFFWCIKFPMKRLLKSPNGNSNEKDNKKANEKSNEKSKWKVEWKGKIKVQMKSQDDIDPFCGSAGCLKVFTQVKVCVCHIIYLWWKPLTVYANRMTMITMIMTMIIIIIIRTEVEEVAWWCIRSLPLTMYVVGQWPTGSLVSTAFY